MAAFRRRGITVDLYDLFFTEGEGGGSSQVIVAVSGIPIDDESLTPLEFGCDAGGFFFSDTTGSGTGFALGRDNTGIYAEATT